MNSKVKFDPALIEAEKSDISMHSDGHPEVNCSPDKFFSFSQSFAKIEQNDKAFQERSNSMSKVKALQEQVKSYKGRSALWQKAKGQIISLNRYLKLSSITLGCSDSAIMKEFFDIVLQIFEEKQGKSKDERSKAADNKKKEAELFQKLVESNKKKYELEQKLVQFEHQISKLTDINESLREKSRVQSIDRSSKFHQETMMTIHQKDSVLYSLEQRNSELKLDVARLEQAIETLNSQLDSKHHDLAELREANEEIQLQLAASHLEIKRLKEAEQETESTFNSIKEEITKIIEENATLRKELSNLKALMEEAKMVNEQFLNETQLSLSESQNKRRTRIDQLLRKEEEVLKKKLANSIKFASSRRKSKRTTHKIPSEMLLLPSEQLLI